MSIKRKATSSDALQENNKEPRDLKCIKSAYATTITVFVGKDQQQFLVHEEIICARSIFFKAAMSKQWEEGMSKVVRLPEASAVAFYVYLECFYDRSIDMLQLAKIHCKDLVPKAGEDIEQDDVYSLIGGGLIELYMLGDFLGDVEAKNQAVGAMVKGWNSDELSFYCDTIRMIFDKTPESSGIHKFMGDVCARDISAPEDVDDLKNNISSNGVVAVLKALAAKRYGGKWPKNLNAQKYMDA